MKGYYNQTLSNRRLNHVHPLVLFLVVSSCRSSVRGAYKRTLPVTTMFQRGVGRTVQATSRKSLSKSIAQLDLTRSRRFSLSQRSLKVAAESVLRRFAADAYKSSPFSHWHSTSAATTIPVANLILADDDFDSEDMPVKYVLGSESVKTVPTDSLLPALQARTRNSGPQRTPSPRHNR